MDCTPNDRTGTSSLFQSPTHPPTHLPIEYSSSIFSQPYPPTHPPTQPTYQQGAYYLEVATPTVPNLGGGVGSVLGMMNKLDDNKFAFSQAFEVAR